MVTGDGIYKLKETIYDIVRDVEQRTKNFMTSYRVRLEHLPQYKEIERNPEGIYELFDKYIKFLDDVTELIVRVDLVLVQVSDVLREDLSSTGSHPKHIKNVRDDLENIKNKLTTYKFDLGDIRKLADYRYTVLKMVSYGKF